MKGGDPNDRNGLEIKILAHLNDLAHPASLRTMLDTEVIEPNKRETISCSVFDLVDDGLIHCRDIGGDHLINLTPQGKLVLLNIFSRTC